MALARLGGVLWRPLTVLPKTIGQVRRSFKFGHQVVRYNSGETVRHATVDIQGRQHNSRWLRENCHCPDCYNHSTEQRSVLFYSLTRQQTEVRDVRADGDKVRIVWRDGHVTEYDGRWLEDNSYPSQVGPAPPRAPQLWDGADLTAVGPHPVPFADFLATDEALGRVLDSLTTLGVGVISDVPATLEGTRTACERICFIKRTLYGEMWSFTNVMEHADTAYTTTSLGAHTDTTYLTEPAGIQVFHCLGHDGTGGETLLVDGFHAAEQLRAADDVAFRTLCDHRVYHWYRERDRHDVRSLAPVLTVHPVTHALENIRYNHYDRLPISTVPVRAQDDYYDALAALSGQLTAPENEFWMKLRPGTVLLMDNWRVLHGRAAYTGRREICGAYLPREDWLSRAEVLRARTRV